MKYIANNKELLRAIAVWASVNKRINNEIHPLAVASLNQWLQHDNPQAALDLLAGMRKSQRKEKLKLWFVEYGAIKFGMKNGKETIKKDKDREALGLDAAIRMPFTEMAQAVSEDIPLEVQLKRSQQTVERELVKLMLNGVDTKEIEQLLSKAQDRAIAEMLKS